MGTDILQVKRPTRHQDDIVGLQYHTYAPYSTAFNNNDEIRITIQSQDLYVQPSESYLLIEFTVGRANGVAIPAASAFAVKYFIAHMFSEMRYELNGFEIDRCKSPGITSLLKTVAACKEEDYQMLKLFDLNAENTIAAGNINMILPLRFVFGFCDDFKKIVLNSKHELILVRHRSNLNMYRETAAVAPLDLQFTVNKIVWKVPHVELSDEARLTMLQTLSRNETLPIAFRSWDLYELPVVPQTTRHTWAVKTTNKVNQPRFVIVAFQTNRNNMAGDVNASVFDNCNISNMKLYLNNERFPYDDFNLDFDHWQYHELYMSLMRIQQSYYNGTGGTNPHTEIFDFVALQNNTFFAFDCTRTNETVKPGMVDVRIEIESRANIPANTSAYCLIIHDNIIKYSPFSSLVHRQV